MVIVFDGNKRKKEILESLKNDIEKIRKMNVNPKLAIINVGSNPASLSYIKMKISALKELKLAYEYYSFDENIEEKELLKKINELNDRKDVNGIIVQLPLPPHLRTQVILNAIDPIKDVDALNEINLGKLMYKKEILTPCTPKGIIDILEYSGIDVEGKNVVIINNSILIGKPLSILLTNRFATVTMCHVKTKDLSYYTKRAEIIITATGVPNLIRKEHISENVVLIDAGFSKINDKITGDVEFEEVKDSCYLITPTPGGVGPMTVAMLIKNLITCTEIQLGLIKNE